MHSHMYYAFSRLRQLDNDRERVFLNVTYGKNWTRNNIQL